MTLLDLLISMCAGDMGRLEELRSVTPQGLWDKIVTAQIAACRGDPEKLKTLLRDTDNNFCKEIILKLEVRLCKGDVIKLLSLMEKTPLHLRHHILLAKTE